MKIDLEVKDALYYSDLMYEIRSYAGIEQKQDEETEQRIMEREKPIVEEQETGPLRYANALSIFEDELFGIVMGISKKAGVSFKGLDEISRYPKLVEEVLVELELKKNHIETNNKIIDNGPKLARKPTSQNNQK